LSPKPIPKDSIALGRTDEARASYRRALELVKVEPERCFLDRRLAEL
jgi:RNA polymerase sigma-70 factor, ECF subfamily